MASTAGIALAELLAVTDQVDAVLPQAIRDFVDKFSVAGLRSSSSPGAILHRGSLQPILPIFGDTPPEFDIGIGTLSLPLLHTGLPFQIAMTRAAVTGTLEPAAAASRRPVSVIWRPAGAAWAIESSPRRRNAGRWPTPRRSRPRRPHRCSPSPRRRIASRRCPPSSTGTWTSSSTT